MSHRKFERPRSGSLAFAPRKRCARSKAKIGAFPKDDPTNKPHLTAFIGYKAGMTHVVREMQRPDSKLNKKEVVEGVTLIETPPMVCVGICGYVKTVKGMKKLTSAWANHVSDGVIRRLDKNYFKNQKKNRIPLAKRKDQAAQIDLLKQNANVIRAIMHTQPELIKQLNTKKVHMLEVQVNGGSIDEKIKFCQDLMEQEVHVSGVFEESESIDTISISKGKGMTGVITRWGVNRLQRKTHRGLRKVACIGAWHPARTQWTVPRAGQRGYHQRTEGFKRIFRVGAKDDPNAAQTSCDITPKSINPISGFPNYGFIKNDWVMLRGPVIGQRKRCVTLRKPLVAMTSRKSQEPINLKFIDTASQIGTGKFQTHEEKKAFFGIMKKDRVAA